ncbi:hypothetical protein KCP69_24270 [Salmonella enterica subsp. enterica]|nr:hypothetical protein KCP69_24270 [Salmonella enterica subsp. enterica]
MPHRWSMPLAMPSCYAGNDNDGAGEMLNPSSAAGHHRRSAYCAVLAEFRQIEVT